MSSEIDTLIGQGFYIEALQIISSAYDSNSKDPYFLYTTGVCYLYGRRDADTAILFFEKARKYGFSGYWLDYHEACALANSGKPLKAIWLLVRCFASSTDPALLPQIAHLVADIGRDSLPNELEIIVNMLDRFNDIGTSVVAPVSAAELRTDLDALNANGLFIIGPARSGTSLALDFINSNREIILYSEMEFGVLDGDPDHYSIYGGGDPVKNYNNKTKRNGSSIIHKGYNIPEILAENFKKGTFWQELQRNHRYFGEKIALSSEPLNGGFLFEKTISWHVNRAPFSYYILCLRDPANIARSWILTFGASGIALTRYVIAAVEAIVHLWRTLPRARVLVFEEWDATVGVEIGEWLGVQFPVNYEDINPRERDGQYDNKYPPELSQFSNIFEVLSEGYRAATEHLGSIAQGPYWYDGVAAGLIADSCRQARLRLYEKLSKQSD